MRKLFGTDGIRAVAGEAPLDPPTIFATGVALASTLKKLHPAPRVLLGSDTRESSPWITAVIAAGLQSGGAEVLNAGVITTPGVAYLTRKHQLAAGMVISASHNPWQDNGIKVFGGDGYKLPDATEMEIEGEIFRRLEEAPSRRDRNPERAPGRQGIPRRIRGLSARRCPRAEPERQEDCDRLRQRGGGGHCVRAFPFPWAGRFISRT